MPYVQIMELRSEMWTYVHTVGNALGKRLSRRDGHASITRPSTGGGGRDDACAGILQERAAVYRRAHGRVQGTRSAVGAARAVAARQHQGPDATERTRRVGDGEAAAGGHLRERPRDDRRQVVVLLLAARLDAVRAGP